MSEAKNKTLKVPLPLDLYERLEAAAAADDRDLDRYVQRMVKQYLDAVSNKAPVAGPLLFQPVGPVGVSAPHGPPPGVQVFPVSPPAHPTAPPVPGRVIPLAVKGGGEGVPIDLLNDNSLNGEAEEIHNPNVSPVVVPRPNPNAPDMFGATHRK